MGYKSTSQISSLLLFRNHEVDKDWPVFVNLRESGTSKIN